MPFAGLPLALPALAGCSLSLHTSPGFPAAVKIRLDPQVEKSEPLLRFSGSDLVKDGADSRQESRPW